MSKRSGAGVELPAEQDVRPCAHMEEMVSAYADGSLRGPARWYMQLHILHCTQCRAAIKHLRVVIDKIGSLREEGAAGTERMPPDRRVKLERALDEVDGSSGGKG